jgi:hypothetical protein
MINADKFREYFDKDLSYAAIGRIMGHSKASVSQYAKKHGFKREYRVQATCLGCGSVFTKQAKSTQSYCAHSCYLKYLSNERSSYNKTDHAKSIRTHQRRAWKTICRVMGVSKDPAWVNHHLDGDVTNDEASNLFVFWTHSLHLKFHHRLRVDNRVKPSVKHGFYVG